MGCGFLVEISQKYRKDFKSALDINSGNREIPIDGYKLGWNYRGVYNEMQLVSAETLHTNPAVLARYALTTLRPLRGLRALRILILFPWCVCVCVLKSVQEMFDEMGFCLLPNNEMENLLGVIGEHKKKEDKSSSSSDATTATQSPSRKRKHHVPDWRRDELNEKNKKRQKLRCRSRSEA